MRGREEGGEREREDQQIDKEREKSEIETDRRYADGRDH